MKVINTLMFTVWRLQPKTNRHWRNANINE